MEKSRWSLPNPDRSDVSRTRRTGDADTHERDADAHERETERALRVSEERFRFLFEDNPTMYFIVDEAGTIQSINRYGAEYLGYTVAELVGRPVTTVIHPEDREIVRQHLAQCMRTPGEVSQWEFRKVRKDGSILWVRELARPMPQSSDGKLAVLIVCEDVTEAKRTAETQRVLSEASSLLASSLEYERTLKAVARLAVPAVADWCVINIVDSDGNMERVEVTHRDPDKEAMARAAPRAGSPVATDVVAEVIRTGKSVLEREISREVLERLTGDERLFQLSLELGTRSGIVVPLRARGRVLGSITLVASHRNYDENDLALATNLADRAALAVDNARLYREAERRAAEERSLREAVEAMGAAGTTDDVVREIARTAAEATSADSAFVTRLHEGRDEVEIVGLSGDVLPREDATIAVTDAHYTRQVIERREPLLVPRLADAEGPLGSGALARDWPEASALVIPLIGGEEPIGALVLLRAPHKPVFSPDEVQHARTFGELAALAFRRIQLLEESEQRREELERVTESRARLMRGFSHDLKNPLGAADAYAQILADGVQGELPQQQLESVLGIRRSIRNSLDLIQELMELARAESGQITLEFTRTDVAAVAREAAQDFRAQATEAGIELVVDATEELIIETDATRVRQVLHNLISNAVKYGAQGQVTVTVETKARGPQAGRTWVALSVIDSGPGIPQEKHERVFQEFTRLDPTAPQGAGVGLAIGRRIARLLGGDITLSSEPGRGSTFTLWLPSPAPNLDRAARSS